MKIKDLELIVVGVFLYCYSTIELLETLAAKHSAMAHYPVLFIHPWFTTPPTENHAYAMVCFCLYNWSNNTTMTIKNRQQSLKSCLLNLFDELFFKGLFVLLKACSAGHSIVFFIVP